MLEFKSLFNEVVNDLNQNGFISSFKFRKRDSRFYKKFDTGSEIIELQFWNGFDISRNQQSLVIKPLYLKRFDIIHEWFEKFSFKALKDQRDNYSIGFDGGMLDSTKEFHFLDKRNSYNSDLNFFIETVEKNARFVFDGYKNIYSLYEYFITPILNQTKNLPNNGADWIFEYLTITKLVNKEKLPDLINILKEHSKILYEKGEPNINEYYNRLDEIFEYLMNFNFENYKNNKI